MDLSESSDLIKCLRSINTYPRPVFFTQTNSARVVGLRAVLYNNSKQLFRDALGIAILDGKAHDLLTTKFTMLGLPRQDKEKWLVGSFLAKGV